MGGSGDAYFEFRIPAGGHRDWLGLRSGEVALRETDRRSQAVFVHQAELLSRVLAGQAAGIEHVGSTAVEGLVAKPIVDVAVRMRPYVDEGEVVRALEAKGYLFRGDQGSQGGFLFVLEDEPGRRTVHVHGIRDGDPQWERYLWVRDRLRRDPDLREAYASLKMELARRFPNDRCAYTGGKGAFLAETAGAAHW